jgi:hypothetical protein
MTRAVASALCFFLLVSLTFAQESPASPTTATGPDRGPIQAALKSYVDAYNHRSLQELLAVWPDLENQKKDYKKIKEHFDDASLSAEQMTLKPLETQSLHDTAVVQAERTDQFVKTETTSQIVGGGLGAAGMPSQDPGPHVDTVKKTVKKGDTVWITLHRTGDAWTIVSVSDKKPH